MDRRTLVPPGGGFADWLAAAQGDLSDNELARRVGMSPTMVGRWKKGSVPSIATLRRIAKWAGVDVRDLEALLPPEEPDPDMVPVWYVEGVMLEAGNPVGTSHYAGVYRARNPEERGHTFYLFPVVGPCMAPRIEPGDSVVVDTTRTDDWSVGDTVAVEHDGGCVVKRVKGTREAPLLVADDGTTLVPNGDTEVIGVVVEIRKRP